MKDTAGQWLKYKPLILKVAEEEIDSHLTYRLINVGYVLWRKMGTYQRNLTSFDEDPIMLNRNYAGQLHQLPYAIAGMILKRWCFI